MKSILFVAYVSLNFSTDDANPLTVPVKIYIDGKLSFEHRFELPLKKRVSTAYIPPRFQINLSPGWHQLRVESPLLKANESIEFEVSDSKENSFAEIKMNDPKSEKGGFQFIPHKFEPVFQ